MGQLQQAIYDRLSGDATLTGAQPGGLGFRVWDRWLLKDGPGKTPEAFDPGRDGVMKRSIVVLDANEVPHAGRRAGADGKRWDSFPIVYLFAETTRSGRDALDAAYRRIGVLLHGWYPVLPSGERPSFDASERTAARDDESFPGNVRCEVRIRATASRSMVA